MTDQPRADAIEYELGIMDSAVALSGSAAAAAVWPSLRARLAPADPTADHVHGLYWCDDCLVEGRRQVRAALAPDVEYAALAASTTKDAADRSKMEAAALRAGILRPGEVTTEDGS